jgi:hypothetical protein
MNEEIKKGLKKLLSGKEGVVVGANDFFYTEHLDRHPCTEFLYLYGWYLKSLGVDTIFVENHYIDEPIQTRGFLGQLMYCCFLFDLNVVGLEFKGSLKQYEQYTGKEVSVKVTTIGYSEKDRVLRLNRVVKDIVDYQKKGKWLVLCGMSHVNDTKDCEGIKTLLGVNGIGIQISNRNAITKGKDFVDGNYKRKTDYLIEISPPEKSSARLYLDSAVLSMMYALLYFFNGYRGLTDASRFSDLFGERPITVRPLWYNDLAEWIMKKSPDLRIPDPDRLVTLVFELCQEVCPRDVVKSIRVGLTEAHMSSMIDSIILFVEKNRKRRDDKSLMNMIFLERKTIPLEKNERDMISAIKSKFHKQLARSETHLFQILQILCVLKLDLPKTRSIHRIFVSN